MWLLKVKVLIRLIWKDLTRWTEDVVEGFEREFQRRYPELGGELVFDQQEGVYKV